MKAALSSLALIILMGSCPLGFAQTARTKSQPASGQIPAAYFAARDITVRIEAIVPTGLESRGSGVVLSQKQGYIATCYHVVKGIPDGTLKVAFGYEPFVNFSRNVTISAASAEFSARVIAFDQDSDIAILKVSGELRLEPLVSGLSSDTSQSTPRPEGATLNADLPIPGTGIVLAGYPLDGATLLLEAGDSTGTSFPIQPIHSAKGLRIMLSVVSNPGNSGGPVLTSDGKLLGLLEGNLQSPLRDETNRQVLGLRPQRDPQGNPVLGPDGKPQFEPVPLTQNSGISFGIPTRFILDLLGQNAIKLQ